jgi:hypothetical protein
LAGSLHIPVWEAETLSSKPSANAPALHPDLETNSMKKTVLTLCLLCASHAFGQYSAPVLSSEPQKFEVPTHEQQATQKDMGMERSLLITSNSSHEHGMRPLWELAPVKIETPLGDTARMLKKQHEGSKKADIVWEN